MTFSSGSSTSPADFATRGLDFGKVAMSAMEQPALRSGRIAFWYGLERMPATSAMKSRRRYDVSGIGLGGELRKPQRVHVRSACLYTSARDSGGEYDGMLAEGALAADDARLARVVGERLEAVKVIVLTSILELRTCLECAETLNVTIKR